MATDVSFTPGADLRLDALAGQEAVLGARPAGQYASFSSAGDLLYSSGVVGRDKGQVITGALDGDEDVALGERAVVASVVAILRAARAELGSLDRVVKVVTLNGYLQAGSAFAHHVRVMNAASAVLQQVFPGTPLPARTTVGVASLPGSGTAEVSMAIQVRPAADSQGDVKP